MNSTANTIRFMVLLGIIFFTVVASLGCGDDSNATNKGPKDGAKSVIFQLELVPSSNHAPETTSRHADGDLDVCTDLNIDTMAVEVHRTRDNELIVTAKANCAKRSLEVAEIPVDESLYVVGKGYSGIKKPQLMGIVGVTIPKAKAGQKVPLLIPMTYIADDTFPPEIIRTYPLEGATGVDRKASIVVVFNEALDPASISAQAITVNNNDISVPGKTHYNFATQTIRFIPEDPDGFGINTTYTATLRPHVDDNGPIKDIGGVSFEEDVSWQFTTGGAEDTVTPKVVITSPVDNATDVWHKRDISMLFSEPMDPNSFTHGAYGITSDQGPISAQFLYDAHTRTLTLRPNLEFNTAELYTVKITSEAKDLSGNAFLEPHTWQFSTIDPGSYHTIRTSIIPANGSGGAISPSTLTVRHGENLTFDIQAKPKHHLAELIVDGTPITPTSSYRLENVTENHEIQAVFEQINLVGHWTFDNTGDDAAGDNHGTLYGGSYVAGKINQAIELDGTDDYVETDPNKSLSLAAYTISVWVNFPDSIQTGWHAIVEYDRWKDNKFSLFKSARGNMFHFLWQNSKEIEGDFETHIKPDTWYHVVGTFENGTAKMYLDGALDKTVKHEIAPTPPASDSKLSIGRNSDGEEYIKAIIDDLRIYDSALSDSDIADLFKNSP